VGSEPCSAGKARKSTVRAMRLFWELSPCTSSPLGQEPAGAQA